MIERALLDRFAGDLAGVWNGEGRLGLAVSGGPDSLALLALAHRTRPGAIEAASIDHGLRPESASEAAMVVRLCAQMGVPHRTIAVQLAPGNLQARAREARYAALSQWAEERGLAAVASAHHADDQAETLLMRLNRGSGLAGLAGVRPVSTIDGVAVVRPLLSWRKAELEAVCAAAGMVPVRDRSNADADFERVRMRQALAQADWIDPPALARSAAHLADALAALEAMVEREWRDRVEHRGELCTYRAGEDRFANIEIVGRILAEFGGCASRAEAARMCDRLERGENASLGGVLASSEAGEDRRPIWSFRREPARRAG